MIRILANDGIDPSGKQKLEAAGYFVDTNKVPQDSLAEALNHYDAVTVRSATQIKEDVIDACPNLKLIGRGGVGMDNIAVEYARSKGIEVVNTPAASSNAVAELVFAHIYSLIRNLHSTNRAMPSEGSASFELLKKKFSGASELRNKTIGIIGFGKIGQAVARIALGSGMKVLANDISGLTTDLEIEIHGAGKVKVTLDPVSMDELLSNSDFISVHVPKGQVIGNKEIEKMKKGVILINTARGGVINETDLLSGLNSGIISGAGLDVFINEPNPDPAILSNTRISLTPHLGASTSEAQERIGTELAERIISYFTSRA